MRSRKAHNDLIRKASAGGCVTQRCHRVKGGNAQTEVKIPAKARYYKPQPPCTARRKPAVVLRRAVTALTVATLKQK